MGMDGQLFAMFNMDYLALAKMIIPGREKNRKNVIKLLEHAEKRTRLYPASTKYHHCWAGGLADHITQVMALMFTHRDALGEGVALWEIPVAAYLHDWEKHWKYEPIGPNEVKKGSALDRAPATAVAALSVVPAFKYVEVPGRFAPSTEISTGILLERFDLPCSRRLSNALMLSEGGWSPHSKEANLDKFATVLHAADMISSHCYQEFSGKGAEAWSMKYFSEILAAHAKMPPLGDGTWPR